MDWRLSFIHTFSAAATHDALAALAVTPFDLEISFSFLFLFLKESIESDNLIYQYLVNI